MTQDSTEERRRKHMAVMDDKTPTCRRCEVPMVHGIATAQTYVGGLPDFEGDKHSSTFSVGGTGRIINVWKCPDCGSSISKGDRK